MPRMLLNLCLVTAMACATAQTFARAVVAPASVEWRDALSFDVEGRGWTRTEKPYDRLPADAKASVPGSVWGLSRDSTGLYVRFQAAGWVYVRWSLASGALGMPHMPATGVSGVDLYARAPDGRWRFVANGRPEVRENNVAQFGLARMSECMLYLPLYNGVSKVEIGAAPGDHLEIAPPRAPQRPIVIYGTSITQGGCASRPGMAWTSIVGRMLDRPIINLGFSGSGKMEPEVADCLAELDPSAYVIDCLANMAGLPDDVIRGRIAALVEKLHRAHPAAPIIFMAQSSIQAESHPTHISRLQEEVVRRLRSAGARDLYLVPGKALLGNDGEGTVDGVHPNDLGMMRMAEAVSPQLRRILTLTRR